MQRLRQLLARIDGRGYKAYKEVKGSYEFEGWTLRVDHVQGDPFAEPSRVSVRIPLANSWLTPDLLANSVTRVAIRDYVTRAFGRAIQDTAKQNRGSGKSGLVAIDRPGQEILARSSCLLWEERLEVRFRMGLPAAGRRVLAREAANMFFGELPRIVEQALQSGAKHVKWARRWVEAAEDTHHLRCQLEALGLVAFVGEDANLPRRSGIDDRPMERDAVPFGPIPDSMRVEMDAPHAGRVAGLGIRKGVTLIVGGGYHGKSTLLSAIAAGIYDHIPGDGRELVATDPAAVVIRSEDGRRVEKVDISPFIADLPQGRSTTAFSTDDASGSTSQAANIIEALEAGATTLVVDEDTSATNFMIRDHRMQLLVSKDQEPIVPFIDRIRELHERLGISTILVLGGSGDYFDVADHVIQMHEYRPRDVTDRATRICRDFPAMRTREEHAPVEELKTRVPLPSSFDPSRGRRAEKVRAQATRSIMFGREEIDISLVQQLVDSSQTRFIADVMLQVNRRYVDGRRTLREVVAGAFDDFEAGFDELTHERFGNRAYARPIEVMAAINRLRTLRMKSEQRVDERGED